MIINVEGTKKIEGQPRQRRSKRKHTSIASGGKKTKVIGGIYDNMGEFKKSQKII